MKHLRNIVILLLGGFVLSGCTQGPPDVPPALSANDYINLANKAKPADKPYYNLAAAKQYIKQEKPKAASKILKTINQSATPQQHVDKQLLEAKIALLNGKAQFALNTLIQIQGNNVILSRNQQRALQRLLANTYEVTGEIMGSIQARIHLQPLLTSAKAQRMNLMTIWYNLQTCSIASLKQNIKNYPDPTIQGWLSLALIIKQSASPNELISNVKSWQSQYPNHPAITLLPKDVTKHVDQTNPAKQIALLLPLSGPYRSTGLAIRNGFLAAYYAQKKRHTIMPHLKIYDSAKSSINTTYQLAISQGANFIIGPLMKSRIQMLIKENEVDVPTLALNTLPSNTSPPENLYQFGLSPLDEAKQAAQHGRQHQHKNAIVITTSSTWGQQIATIFQQSWTQAGGNIVQQININSSDNINQQVSDLLHINLASENYQKLRALLHTKMRFIPRRRKDIDLIYVIAQPDLARQIIPLLKYYFAGNIPTYALSQLYNGTNNTQALHDLNGVYFCDMPWVLTPNAEPPQLQQVRQQIETIWPLSYSHHRKLYALGIDAFTLSEKLQQMQSLPQFSINGATGNLFLDSANHIYRGLLWARFINGTPVLQH